MKLTALCLATAFVAVAAGPSWSGAPMNEADCTAWMTKADKNADGSLGGDEAAPFMEKMTAANMKPKDAGIVSKEEFMATCAKGEFEGVPS